MCKECGYLECSEECKRERMEDEYEAEIARLNAVIASLLAENAKLKAALESVVPGNVENGELR